MPTPRERLEELRALESQSQQVTPRARLEQLRQLEAQSAPIEEIAPEVLPEGDLIDRFVEPVKSIATGLGAQIAGGLSSIGTLATGGSLDEAVETIDDFQSKAFTPKTQAGQEGLETIGDVVESVSDFASEQTIPQFAVAELIAGRTPAEVKETIQSIEDSGFTETAGRRVLEETGSPLLATIAKISPEIIGSVLPIAKIIRSNVRGVSAIPSSKINPEIKNPFTPPSATQAKIADQLAKGGTDKSLAKFIKDGAGGIETDKLAISAIKQGFEPGVIAAVKGSSRVDKVKMSRMVGILKRGRENALFATKNRPSDVAGDSLLERVKLIKKVNSRAGKRLDIVAKKLKGKAVDSTAPVDNFIASLDDMGINLGDDLIPKFEGSIIEGLAGPENAIKNIVKRLARGKVGRAPDAFDLHRMKKFIDEQVTFGKTAEGLSGKTELVLKKLRRDIDKTLDSNFPEYDKVNTTFAETINALDSLQSVAGGKMDLLGPNADKAVGTLLRRIMSNAQSRVNLVDAIDEIESVAKKFGGNFKDDVTTQMLFVDELNTRFKPAARTSFQGDIAKEVARTAEGQRTVLGTVAEGAGKLAEKVRGISDENAIKSIDELLKRK